MKMELDATNRCNTMFHGRVIFRAFLGLDETSRFTGGSKKAFCDKYLSHVFKSVTAVALINQGFQGFCDKFEHFSIKKYFFELNKNKKFIVNSSDLSHGETSRYMGGVKGM